MTHVQNMEIDGVRARNAAHILRLVHFGGPQTRAELTKATGLNRSTIADIVRSLADDGWVAEHESTSAGRVGRPSPVVAASPKTVVIAANPEIDALEIAAIDLARGLVVRERIEYTHAPTAPATAKLIGEVVTRWRQGPLAGFSLKGVGIAVPGIVREEDGLVRNAPHLNWIDEPLQALVTETTELPVAAGNDASLGALAEHLFGAASGENDVVYLNGSPSGIGGGIIAGGELLGGVDGYAGELGHNRISFQSDDVFEDVVNRRRLLKAAGFGAMQDPELAQALRLTKDPKVAAEFEHQRAVLAFTITNVVNLLNPAIVVLGGFLAMFYELDSEKFLARIRASAIATNTETLTIRPASLAEDRLLLGAAELAIASFCPIGQHQFRRPTS